MKNLGLVISRGLHVPPSAQRDALLLPGLFLVNCLSFSQSYELIETPPDPWLFFAYLCGLVGLLPLIWRNRAPIIVFVVQWVIAVISWPLLQYYCPLVGVMVALYTVSVHCGRKFSLGAFLTSLVPFALDGIPIFQAHAHFTVGLITAMINFSLLVAIAGAVSGSGRLTRANKLDIQKIERERDEAKEAVIEERKSLARELHDIVSHAVTVMVIQAGSAARLAETDCSRVLQPLADIETYGRRAMAELRRLLGVLDGAGRRELKPQPGLADLDEILGSMRDAGMMVAVHTDGKPRELDASVDLAAYRIVQEALTNVLKHSGIDSNPHLRIAWQAESLYLEVNNDVNSTNTHRGRELSCSRGLLGLHERVSAVGGHLQTGPQRDRYQLTATLPLADTVQQTLVAHRPSPSSTAGMAASE